MPIPTPLPYVAGRSLNLIITRTFNKYIHSKQLPVTIQKTFSITQSPVMVVTFDTQLGPMKAILKLYDRRFGPDFRTIGGRYSPHTSEDEAIWQEYVHQGRAPEFFDRIKQDQAASRLYWSPEHYYEDSWEGRAQYEGGLQRRVLEYFDTETATYERLADIQGTYIPTMLAHVYVSQPLPDLAKMEVYFRIPDILIQLINSCSLWQLADPSNAPKAKELEGIVQEAVDIANAINDHGVVMKDCRPQNVIVEWDTHQPFIHDFAQCGFKEACTDDPDDPNDQGYQDVVCSHGNQRAIGMVVTTRVKRELGFQLNIQYRHTL
ncbi:hypothetical protein F4819DRAFT_481118 [Hypoxylon fuscum]|nr:hypothetical protein F4819DRAFT_481118 [Hypoxylon fuscum]